MAKLDDSDFQAIVAGAIEDAINFIDDEISPSRAFATKYYQGEVPDLESEPGKSRMVSRDVRDTVQAIMPSLMRVFFSSERIVEYVPTQPEDVKFAEQATDYANYVIQQENDGFTSLYAVFKDSLIRKCGFLKVWWDEKEETIKQMYTGLDEQTMLVIQSEPDVEVSDVSVTYDQVTDELGQMVQVPYFDCTVTKRMKKGQIKVCEIPQEELIVAREDKYLGETFVAHRTFMTVSDLVQMGYDQDLLEANTTQEDFSDNEEYLARTDYQDENMGYQINPAMRKVLYVEAYMKVDRDGDGVAENIKVCTIGNGYEVVSEEPCEFHPFVAFPCDPEPHLSPVDATSIADDTIDIQRVKSAVWRNSLDALAQALNPRTGVVEGQANVDDVLNNEVGAVIRMKNPNAVVPFVTPDTSPAGLSMLGYIDQVKEARTGISRAAMGLDADALRSTAVNAANAVITATQARIELVTRVLANGMRDLFKLILKLSIAHQDKPKMIRLRNEWVQIDPRMWNSQMDVTINVALGTGTTQEKFSILGAIAQKQELILTTMGASNPLVSLAQYSNTIAKMVEMAGFRNSEAYITRLPEDFQMPEQPQVDPNQQAAELLAQVEREKAQANMQVQMMKMEVERAKAEAKAQLEAAQLQLDREKLEAEFAQKQLELEMQAAKQQAELQMKEAELVLKQLTQLKGSMDNESENANEESRQEANEARQEGLLAQATFALGQMIAQSQQQTAQALAAPKRVLRDQTGRMIGVEPVLPSAPEKPEEPESEEKEDD